MGGGGGGQQASSLQSQAMEFPQVQEIGYCALLMLQVTRMSLMSLQ